MDELELMSRLLEEVPPPPTDQIEQAFLAAIRRPKRLRRLPVVRVGLAASLGLAACAAGFVAFRHGPAVSRSTQIAWSGRPTAAWPRALPYLGRATTADQLVDFVGRAAALAPDQAPSPHDWLAIKVETADSSAGHGGYLFGPPDKRVISLGWYRIDGCEGAGGVSVSASMPARRVVSAKINVSPSPCGLGLAGWKSTAYSYLASLPSSPAALESVIMTQNTKGTPWYQPSRDVAIFSAITVLFNGETEGVAVPPKLAATMWRTLRELPEVHFERATDLAGRTGLGFYLVMEGYFKQELVVDPSTYAFMGEKDVAIKDHTMTGTDGTRHIANGQVLGWQALLASAIVHAPGQVPGS